MLKHQGHARCASFVNAAAGPEIVVQYRLQEAVEAVLGAFLLPQRDLRSQRAQRQRPSFHLVRLLPLAFASWIQACACKYKTRSSDLSWWSSCLSCHAGMLHTTGTCHQPCCPVAGGGGWLRLGAGRLGAQRRLPRPHAIRRRQDRDGAAADGAAPGGGQPAWQPGIVPRPAQLRRRDLRLAHLLHLLLQASLSGRILTAR